MEIQRLETPYSEITVCLLGNLKTDGAEKILENYAENRSLAQSVRMNVPVCELVKAQGNPASRRLFGKSDYIQYLLNTYCRSKGNK